ncbi:HAD family hydrolase [Paenibacillus doosanensis]|uniref:HAD family hydrolase n=1 Tax=Paenibacillus doosanensis TaxID=1229154 RepID=UPI00217FA922|nr:HAD family hydrolase [Paenibacillus doosanensis]MCS7460249.1 HAD family hydrolase [Paenibacillus doosanensis]
MKFVFDLDGTICFRGKPLSENMVHALDELVNEGHEIIFASARPIRDLLPVLPAHMRRFPMVGGNGGFVYREGRQVCVYRLEPSVAQPIMSLLQQFEADYLIDGFWDYCYSGDPQHPIRSNLDPEGSARNVPIEELGDIVKVVVLRSRNHRQLLGELEKLPVMMYMHGTENIIDLSPAGIDKWTGLQALGLSPRTFIAFGNDANDVPMFRVASRSVCVGEHAELRRMATESVAGDEEAVIRKIGEMASLPS